MVFPTGGMGMESPPPASNLVIPSRLSLLPPIPHQFLFPPLSKNFQVVTQ